MCCEVFVLSADCDECPSVQPSGDVRDAPHDRPQQQRRLRHDGGRRPSPQGSLRPHQPRGRRVLRREGAGHVTSTGDREVGLRLRRGNARECGAPAVPMGAGVAAGKHPPTLRQQATSWAVRVRAEERRLHQHRGREHGQAYYDDAESQDGPQTVTNHRYEFLDKFHLIVYY